MSKIIHTPDVWFGPYLLNSETVKNYVAENETGDIKLVKMERINFIEGRMTRNIIMRDFLLKELENIQFNAFLIRYYNSIIFI